MLRSTPPHPIDAVARYAERFHAALGDVHSIASPLGAWLLLAAVAPLAEGPARAGLEAVLGCTAEEAHTFLRVLLATPHPAVAPALAIWGDAERVGDALALLTAGLGESLATGPIPSAPAADAWVRAATGGILHRLPVEIEPRTICLLVSALATQAKWKHEFSTVGAEELGPRSWDPEVRDVLWQIGTDGNVILTTESAGLVAALVSQTESDMLVVSVIAAPEVPAPRVIAAAHEIAARAAGRNSSAAPRSLFDLPLGAGHAWTLTEEEFESDRPGERLESAEVKLPAWHVAESVADLLRDPAFGFHAAAAALESRFPRIPEGYEFQAVQATTGKFDRHGFSAAAVTVFDGMVGMAGGHREKPRWKGRRRHAEVRFARPFAVVAVAMSPDFEGPTPCAGTTPWRGVPLFSAWVTQAIEAEQD